MAKHIKALRLSKLNDSVMVGQSSLGIADEDYEDDSLDVDPIEDTSIHNTLSKVPPVRKASNDNESLSSANSSA